MYSFLSIFFILKSWNRGAEDWVITKDKSNVHVGQSPVTLEKSLTNKDKAVFKCHLFCCGLFVEVRLKNPGKKENSRSVEECWRARSPPLYKSPLLPYPQKSALCVSLLKYFSSLTWTTFLNLGNLAWTVWYSLTHFLRYIYYYDGIFWGTDSKELYCYKSICLLIECLIQQHWISTQEPPRNGSQLIMQLSRMYDAGSSQWWRVNLNVCE